LVSHLEKKKKKTYIILIFEFSDAASWFAIQKGVLVSRAQVKFFKHNDMEDLENILKQQQALDKKV